MKRGKEAEKKLKSVQELLIPAMLQRNNDHACIGHVTAVRKRDDPLNISAWQHHLCYNSLAAHSLPTNC